MLCKSEPKLGPHLVYNLINISFSFFLPAPVEIPSNLEVLLSTHYFTTLSISIMSDWNALVINVFFLGGGSIFWAVAVAADLRRMEVSWLSGPLPRCSTDVGSEPCVLKFLLCPQLDMPSGEVNSVSNLRTLISKMWIIRPAHKVTLRVWDNSHKAWPCCDFVHC